MELSLNLTEDERHACRRAAVMLRVLGKGLQEIGTKAEGVACEGYAVTLDRIVASGECCSVSADGKVDVEQAAFVLEGIRDGLDNADLDEGADFVQRDIERLNDLVLRYNDTAAERLHSR